MNLLNFIFLGIPSLRIY